MVDLGHLLLLGVGEGVVQGVGLGGVEARVHAHHLFHLRRAQADRWDGLESVQKRVCEDEGPGSGYDRRHHLVTEELGAVRVEGEKEAVGAARVHLGLREEAQEHRAHHTRCAVAEEAVEGVGDILLEVLDAEEAHQRTHAAKDERAQRADEPGGGRHSRQPDHRARHRAEPRRHPLDHAITGHPGEHAHASRDVRVDRRQGRNAARAERRTAVEAVPAEPKKRGSNENERERVSLLFRDFLGGLADHEGCRERRKPRSDVHNDAAGEVENAEFPHPAVLHLAVLLPGAPHPVRDRVVQNRAPDQHEEDPRAHPEAPDDRARDERRSDHRERKLEPPKGEVRKIRAVGFVGLEADTDRPVEVFPANHAVARAEGERVPEEHPLDADKAHGHEGEHERVQHVSFADHPAVE
mmetsp:Transcript_18051/g.41297  ORF Transcript_18051/g.41297 Transcript_18051/m.41297 type:complete len:410 (+) Transcript_18051:294-1523(+)